jgi:hypothetical protein
MIDKLVASVRNGEPLSEQARRLPIWLFDTLPVLVDAKDFSEN